MWSDTHLPEVPDLASIIVSAHEANNVSSAAVSKRSRTHSMSNSSKIVREGNALGRGDRQSSTAGRPSSLLTVSSLPPQIPSTTTSPTVQPRSTQPPRNHSQNLYHPFHSTLTTPYPSNASSNPNGSKASVPSTSNTNICLSIPTTPATYLVKQEEDENCARIDSAELGNLGAYSADEDDKDTSTVAENLLRYSSEEAQGDVEDLAIEYLRRFVA